MLQARPDDLKTRLELSHLLLQAGQLRSALEQARWMAHKQPENASVQELLANAASLLGNHDEAFAAASAAVTLAPGNAEYHTKLGALLLSDPRQQQRAFIEFSEAIRLDPAYVQAHIYMAQLQESKGDTSAAVQELKRAIQQQPQSLPAYTSLAALYLRSGNQAAAEEILLTATDRCSNNPDAAPLLDRFYQQTGQTNRASAAYASMVAKHPQSLALQVACLRALMNSGDYDSVRSRLEPLVQDHSSDPDVALMQATMLLHDGKTGDAVELLKKASQNDPNRSDILLLLSDAQERSGQIQDALSALRRAVQVNPSNMEAATALARFGYRTQNPTATAEAASHMRLFHPDAAEVYLWRGIAELQSDKNQQAVVDLQESLKRLPGQPFTTLQLGLALKQAGDTDKAKAAFERVLQTAPDPAAASALADLQLRAGHVAEAVAMLQQQTARDPRSSQLYRVLAQAQLVAGDTKGAEASARHGLALAPAERSLLQVFSEAALANGNLNEPVTRWQQWMTDHPNDPHGPAALGALYESAGEETRAMELYRRSLALQPDQPEISAAIASLSADTGGNLDVALSLAQTAYQAAPGSAQAADAVGWINYKKGLPASGLVPLRSAAALDGTNATILYHLGTVQATLGDMANAGSNLRRAHSLAVGTRLDRDIQ
ncbi:MAG: tetratricopeptide repeat protein, partial [Terriglobus sp.]